jgi:hypothetical protein
VLLAYFAWGRKKVYNIGHLESQQLAASTSHMLSKVLASEVQTLETVLGQPPHFLVKGSRLEADAIKRVRSISAGLKIS